MRIRIPTFNPPPYTLARSALFPTYNPPPYTLARSALFPTFHKKLIVSVL